MSDQPTIEPDINVHWVSNCAGEIFLKTEDGEQGLRIGHFQGDAALAAYLVSMHHEKLTANAHLDSEVAPWLEGLDPPKPQASSIAWMLAMKKLTLTLEKWHKANESLKRKLAKRDKLLLSLAPWIERANERSDVNIPGLVEMRKITKTGPSNPNDLGTEYGEKP